MRRFMAFLVIGASLLLVWQYVANWHTIQGVIMYTLGERENAVVSFKRALEKDQKNIYAHYYLAQLNYEQGRYKDAIFDLQRVVQLVPVHHAAYMLLADCYSALSEYEPALQAAGRALTLQPANSAYYFHLGLIHKTASRFTDAVEAFNQAILLGADDRDILFNLSYANFQTGRIDQAVEQFKQTLNLYPGDFQSHLYLARSYQRLQQTAASIREYLKASEIDSSSFIVHLELSSLLQTENRLDAAYDSLQRALRLDTDYEDLPGRLFSLGMAFKNSQKLDRARSLIEQAASLKPGNADYPYQLGLIYKEEANYLQAVRIFSDARLLGFSGVDLGYDMAYSLINLGRYEEALQELRELLINAPDHAYAHADLARIYRLRNKNKEAIREFEIDVALTPADFFSHYDLGLLYKGQGDYELAREHLEKARKLDPEYPFICDALTAVYSSLGVDAQC